MTPTLRLGDLLDNFRLNWLVARSGMSSVYRATDIRTGTPVAIKVPHSVARPWLSVNRFDRETGLLRKLDHPGIVRVLPQYNWPYVAMEWIEGRLLREILDQERDLEVDRALHITLQICNVLAYLHERDIVHLDLKPDNMIVEPNDDVKLIDFDLAREVRPGFWDLLRGKRTGTPDYASPEQIKGRNVGVLSDIYSLGLMLYEMLTGEVPFSGAAPAIAAQLKLHTDPPAPQDLNPEIPAELDDLICRSIARDPHKRPQSAQAFYREIHRIAESCAHELAF